jgi:hypothetical protein
MQGSHQKTTTTGSPDPVSLLLPLTLSSALPLSPDIYIDTSEYYGINNDKCSKSWPSQGSSRTLHGMKTMAREIVINARAEMCDESR